nr:MAG TPA: hypothetical protein [Caudoviricetes sp.]
MPISHESLNVGSYFCRIEQLYRLKFGFVRGLHLSLKMA